MHLTWARAFWHSLLRSSRLFFSSWEGIIHCQLCLHVVLTYNGYTGGAYMCADPVIEGLCSRRSVAWGERQVLQYPNLPRKPMESVREEAVRIRRWPWWRPTYWGGQGNVGVRTGRLQLPCRRVGGASGMSYKWGYFRGHCSTPEIYKHSFSVSVTLTLVI